jgi:hypothetical protein
MTQNNILTYQMIDNLINQIFGQTDEREKLQAFAAHILLEQQKLNSPRPLAQKWGKEHAETSYGYQEYNPIQDYNPNLPKDKLAAWQRYHFDPEHPQEYNPIKFPIMNHQIKGA